MAPSFILKYVTEEERMGETKHASLASASPTGLRSPPPRPPLSSGGEGPHRIRRSGPSVVQRIAAEVVPPRPASAAKELLENCIDARSTVFSGIIRGGSFKVSPGCDGM